MAKCEGKRFAIENVGSITAMNNRKKLFKYAFFQFQIGGIARFATATRFLLTPFSISAGS